MSKGKSFFNFCAFIATVCIGVALLVGKLLHIGSIANIFTMVAEIFAYLLCAISSFFYVHYKRHWAYYLIWAIAVILIVLSYVFGSF